MNLAGVDFVKELWCQYSKHNSLYLHHHEGVEDEGIVDSVGVAIGKPSVGDAPDLVAPKGDHEANGDLMNAMT